MRSRSLANVLKKCDLDLLAPRENLFSDEAIPAEIRDHILDRLILPKRQFSPEALWEKLTSLAADITATEDYPTPPGGS